MSRRARKSSPRTKADREIELIYAEIPSIPSCSGKCSTACGPIAMFTREWDRVKNAKGHIPKMRPGSADCPMLSHNGMCTVYTVRPYICRLWGTTDTLRCPEGCEPDRWLTREEAHDIFVRLSAVAGPGHDGPLGKITDLWSGFALEAREERAAVIERIRQAKLAEEAQ